jgi:hypothetical protein
MRFKKTTWLNTDTDKPVYGLKLKYACMDKFVNVAINGKPALFNTEKERDQKIAEIKKDPVANEFDRKMKMVKLNWKSVEA